LDNQLRLNYYNTTFRIWKRYDSIFASTVRITQANFSTFFDIYHHL